jgi:hypothetical protein
MQEAYLVPYGAIAFASDIVTLYMVTCLLFGRAPLCPARRIRNTGSAKFLIGFWIFNLYVMNKYNVEQCWQYWELVLINVSNGVMGAPRRASRVFHCRFMGSSGQRRSQGK